MPSNPEKKIPPGPSATPRVVSGAPGIAGLEVSGPCAHSCQLSDLLRLLGKNHMLTILVAFCDKGPLRFVELQRSLRLSPNTLSGRLRELVEAGLLTRTTYNEIPPRVDYAPTPKANELFSIFGDLISWSSRHDLQPEPMAKSSD